MITKDELTMGRDKTFPDDYTEQISDNLDDLLVRINVIRTAYNKPMIVSSGFRPPSINAGTPGAAPHSNHMLGLAVDIQDLDGALWNWCMQNLQLFKDNGLYLEDRRWTKGWCHWQSIKPGSGKRIFIAAKGLAPYPELFDGKYDSKFDSKATT